MHKQLVEHFAYPHEISLQSMDFLTDFGAGEMKMMTFITGKLPIHAKKFRTQKSLIGWSTKTLFNKCTQRIQSLLNVVKSIGYPSKSFMFFRCSILPFQVYVPQTTADA